MKPLEHENDINLDEKWGEIGGKIPNTIAGFLNIQEEMLTLFCKKQSDYGSSNIGMGKNILETDEDVHRALLGLSVRLNDKIQRLLNLTLSNKEPNNESVEDTLIDISNYGIMGILCLRKVWGK